MQTRMPDAPVEEESANQPLSEQEETLGEILATQARRASDSLLAGHAIAATLALVGIAAWRGPLWDIRLSVAVCLLAFGIWGIADRDLRSDAARSRGMLRLLRSVRVG